MFKELKLFKGLSEEEIKNFLEINNAIMSSYKEGEYIFEQDDMPKYLYILLEGSISVERMDINGKRTIINQFREKNTVFGEVYLYVDSKKYDYSALSIEDSKILSIEKEAFEFHIDDKYSKIITNNMLEILSNKAFYLNQKILIYSSFSLRQKLSKFFLLISENKDIVELELNREELADFLGVTRPSISRELMNMQEDGLIKIDKNKVSLNRNLLKDFL